MKKAIVAALALGWAGLAEAAPPIEAYGELPEIRSIALSPDGAHAAYLQRQDGKNFLVIYEFGKGVTGGARIDDVKARSVSFAGPRYVILRVSDTTRVLGYIGRLEYSAAYSYSLDSKKIVQLLDPAKTEDLYPAQSGLGRIVGVLNPGDDALMPAFMGVGDHPAYDLLKVDLKRGGGRTFASGNSRTIDWIADRDGTILAREDYDNDSNKYEVFTRRDGKWRSVIKIEESPQIPFSLLGVNADRSALIIADEGKSDGYAKMHELSFDGVVSPPVFERLDADVESIMLDDNRVALGAEYSGLYPSYDFYDAKLEKAIADFQAYFADDAAYLVSWTDDFTKLLFLVEGSNAASDYYLFDREKKKAERIAQSRPDIAPEDIGQVLTIEYKARDGLAIPALLTLPPGAEPKGLPLIVMPHGGPESYDTVGFDWLAQFFASRGYLVFQPNFRGSAGFGVAFRKAGRGEWGGKMQDDITDGVRALIKSGRADPDRACIVGGSYGGYAALAGGAFTPDLYKCVAAIAPVSDLPQMLIAERKEHGKDSWVLDYWKDVIGDPKAEREKLERISPVNHAAAFKAPVLLIHGKDDLVVPISQSERMERALKAAGKSVELVRLKGEDHWLSSGETRLATLKALDAFVTAHIGGKLVKAEAD